MKLKDFFKIYAAILLSHVAAQFLSGDFSLLFFTKLLIPLSVMLYNFYYNYNKIKNTLLTSSFAFFLLGNVLMLVKPTYDPCRFDTPILAYSAAFVFLAILPLIDVKWNIQNLLMGLGAAIVNLLFSYLYILSGLESDAIIFYLFVISFTFMTFTSFLYHSALKRRKWLISGLVCISVSNHILGFCTFRMKNTYLVPLAMLLYGLSLLFFMLGYIENKESENQSDTR